MAWMAWPARVIAEADEYGQLNVTGVGEAPAEGLRKGVVVNIDKTVQAIQQATVVAERMAGVRAESVIVSLAGPHLTSQNSRGVIAVSRPSREIEPDDVQRVVDAARAVSVPNDRQRGTNRSLLGANRVTIHRGTWLGGLVEGRDEVRSKNPAVAGL